MLMKKQDFFSKFVAFQCNAIVFFFQIKIVVTVNIKFNLLEIF